MECTKTYSPQPQFFGEIHNQALDYAYEKLKQYQSQEINPVLGLKVQSTITTALDEFFKLNLPDLITSANSSAQNSIQNFYMAYGNVEVFQEKIFSNIFFSPVGTGFLDELQNIISLELSPEEFQTALTNIYNNAYASEEIKSREAEQLLSILQIGIYSSRYWADSQNQDKWGTLIGNEQLASRVNWSNVGKIDVAGAAGGAVRWGVLALFGGPVTWAAFGGSVVAGAAAASTAAIVYSWLS